MNKLKVIIIASSILSFSALAEIQWSGFGSIVGGVGLGDDIIVDSELGVDGHNDEFEFKSGSFFALQASSDLGEGLAATVQVMSRGDNDWDPDFTWAYLSYDINEEWRILVGRQRMPHYMYSDYIDVSYAYHWITPPAEVYGAPFDSLDGISIMNTHNFENSSLTTQVLYGRDKSEDNALAISNIIGGRITYNYDWLTIRLAHFSFDAEATIPVPGPDGQLMDIFISGGVTSQDVAVQIDYNDWLFIAEYSPVDVIKLGIGELKPWMVSVAKRFDSITPHLTLGRRKSTSPLTPDDTPFSIAGLRWDFHESAAFKVEYSGEEDLAGNTAQSFQVAIVSVF